jgi:crotonobetainyl-CoA:carnitine CoA-transferase CaiB-like acyl-CoA transferase
MTSSQKGGGMLSGYRVIDLSTVVLGPFATMMLGDLGADVIKIEPPEGDIMRHAGPQRSSGMGPIYLTINRNKRALTLDLRKEGAKKTLRRLIATADVLIHNVRAAGMARLGFDYESVKAIRPDIVYVHAVGFATGGHYEGRQAFDDLIQAASGIASMLDRQDGVSGPRYFPGLVADKTTGLYAAFAAVSGLLHRERTGEGQFIEVPMLECMVSYTMAENLFGHAFVPPMGPTAYNRSIAPSRRPYRTKDGHLAIMPYSDANWRAFFELGGRPELMRDPRFSTYKARTMHSEELYATVAEIAPLRTSKEWFDLLGEAQVPAMVVHTLESVLEDPQLRDTGFLEERTHPSEGEYLAVHPPLRFSAFESEIRREPPLQGEHNREILGELGFDEREIAALEAEGAIG